MRQGRLLTASLLIFLFATQCVRDTDAAKFIRNRRTQECLEHTGPSSGCSPVSITACPNNRFAPIQDSLRWNVISDDPSVPLNNASEILVQSHDANVCLTASSSVSVEACPCENGKLTQKWKPNGDNWMSASNEDRCLAVIGNEVTLGSCNRGASQSSWNAYHTTPDGVYAYPKPLFGGEASRLALSDTLTRESLPSEMFSEPFSLEVPPGFQLVVENGNGNEETFDSDIAQLDPISSTAKIVISLKPGVVIYEYPTYFGTSEHFANGFITNDNLSKSLPIGSVMVAKGSRGVVWESNDRKGDTVGLFDPIANFTGVNTASQQMSAGSFEVSGAECSKECAAGGFCSGEGECVCRPGFAGDQCERCASGFWGPTCESCAEKCGDDPRFTCDDGHAGTGECKCAEGFTGENCDQCAPGFFGSNCEACNCGQGQCDDDGTCTCNAGWTNGAERNCSVCDKGYYLDDGSCVACAPGCAECESGSGECTECFSGATKDEDNPSRCIPQSASCPDGEYADGSGCESCDSACDTCIGPGPSDCLQCKAASYYFQGSCFPATNDGKCQTDSSGNFFASNSPASQGVCQPCPSGCSDCKYDGRFSRSTLREDLVCTQCSPGFVLDDDQCKEDCPDGKYLVDDECRACDAKCARCTGPDEDECLACTDSSQFAKNGVCSSESCGSGFVARNTTCVQCHPDCAECSGPNEDQCTQCPASRPVLTQDKRCAPVCPEGSYADESGTCQSCHDDCASCVGPDSDQCLSCSDLSRVMVEGSCTGSCPADTVLLKTERVCMTNDNSLVAPYNTEKRRSFPWWAIVLIVLAVVGVLAAIFFLYRRHAINKRRKRTDNFGRKVDANLVEKNLQRLREEADVERGSSVPSDLPAPETNETTVRPLSKASFRTRELGVTRETLPPTYDHRDGERYWRDAFDKKYAHSDRRSARSDDWDGFEVAVLDEKGKVAVGSPPKAVTRNGSTSRHSKSTKKPNSWGENWI